MAIPFLLLPAPLYLFFGVVLAGPAVAGNPGLGNHLFSGWSVFATMMPALFGAGCTLAIERDAGLLRLKRALPAPAVGNLIFLPMLWLSGLFIPLPDFLERLVVIWPAFHLNQVALGLAGVTGYIFVPVQFAAAVLVGVTVLCGGLAIRRLARTG